ncbi:glycerophosphodiester phosphodiesterase family protein [Testudinibacter aquarius]|uniref:Glycerophosphodiester phosphodiesterase family protein n=1 Tax=Testudinibacter aquarius TaxID=1524974 RepID=A0A4R3YBQ9_9PAST|nr:glycerophosphodiester phosphodiesterase family protein [Testudinibacter aquarius]KAE9529836.1 hypothetical protein A1D24_07910 [Testudinibacter aquarius]TCV89400.1 glycerophosphoryl diester phosphodiesterase [Testudinibacter aquarius]TNG90094.1 glycerophosphodiester phosphodiesterase family protein [Testudinibacter aquarius]
MKYTIGALVLFLSLTALSATAMAPTHVDAILERLNNANDHRDHVMVVAHRGLWNKNGQTIYPEASISSVRKAIELEIEVVEQDIRKSKDGVFFVLHDDELERTTTCSGSAKEKTMQELKQCKLKIVNQGQETATDEQIPTLEELYVEIKGHILLNLDNKISYEEFPAMFELAKKHGVEKQILASVNQNTPEQRESAKKINADLAQYGVNLMPNIYDNNVDFTLYKTILAEYQPKLVQLRNAHKIDGPLTQDGGIFFSPESLELAKKYNTHYWINTLYDPGTTPGLRSGGRGDEMAFYAKLPSEVYGFWAKKGVTMFQTDEPEFLLQWLSENGYRKPYNN